MSRYRVIFTRGVMGVPFVVASVDIQNARDAQRAAKAAEQKLTRKWGADWRARADAIEVERLDTD